jgi:hypothetical protein
MGSGSERQYFSDKNGLNGKYTLEAKEYLKKY